jgi:hypothetical protein
MKKIKCQKCRSEKMFYRWRDFDDGIRGIVRICGDCGTYLGYVHEVKPYTELVSGEWTPPEKKL